MDASELTWIPNPQDFEIIDGIICPLNSLTMPGNAEERTLIDKSSVAFQVATKKSVQLQESSEDGFADDESTGECQPTFPTSTIGKALLTNLPNVAGDREGGGGFGRKAAGKPDQPPQHQPLRWPHVPLLPPEHYDAWLMDLNDPQDTIREIFRDFYFPGRPNLSFFRSYYFRTENGLVDLDLVDPCLPGHPCLLDRMCYRDRGMRPCYEQPRYRGPPRGFYGAPGTYY